MTTLCSFAATAQMTVSGGSPGVSQAFQVPPGRGGLAPTVGLTYTAGGLNGAEGNGWGLMGLSTITRCAAIRATDGVAGTVRFDVSDKLCLDGQRLIQTDESGNAAATANAVGVAVATQVTDAQGLASGSYREYRTETDSYVRVRAYGYADGANAASGPAWFRVWTKDNHIVDYGAAPSADSNTQALVKPYGKTMGMVWAIARMADVFGNFVDFKYEQRDAAFGTILSGCTPACTANGHEWNLREIQYSGNKVAFNYSDRVARSPEDRAEAWQNGSKSVSVRRLDSVVTYVNSPNTTAIGPGTSAVAVKTFKLTYDNGPVSGRSRLVSWQTCAGAATSTRCMPAAKLSYTAGASDAFVSNTKFTADALASKVLVSTAGTSGVLTGDFNGDGRTDILYWSNTPAQNALYLSNGDGTFTPVPNGTGPGQFNLTDINLFYRATATSASDGCYMSTVVDFNGDGRADILRWANSGTGAYGESCPAAGGSYVLLSNGDGSFTTQSFVAAARRTPLTGTSCVGGYINCSTSGANFYLGDFDGDGITDVITVSYGYVGIPTYGNTLHCLSGAGTCSTVFTPGKGDGTFDTSRSQTLETTDLTLFAPPSADGLRVEDFNGDGRADLELQSAQYTNGIYNGGVYVSNLDATGKLSFSLAGQFPTCSILWHTNVTRNELVDFNGDGRDDYLCANSDRSQNQIYVSLGSATGVSMSPITPTTVSGRVSFTGAGQDLVGSSAMLGATFTIADFNGDGRSDVLRVANDPTKNVLYISNGDGSFTASTSLTFDSGTAALTNSDGSTDFATGDFTGSGNVEILRMQTTNNVASNRLYVKSDPTQPDLLQTFTSEGGQKTQLYYVAPNHSTPSNGVSGTLGPRYVSDRGTSNAATGRTQDANPSAWLVATAVSDSGVGAQTLLTEYSYAGFKQDLDGRGGMGFRDVKRQAPSPAGNAVTTDTTYLQQFPYVGMNATTSAVMATLNATSGKTPLSADRIIWCDQTAAAGADSTAISSGVPCPSTAKIRRPYPLWDQQTANDLGGNVLPSITTQTAVNASTDPLTSTVTKTLTGSASDTFTTTVKTDYFPDTTTCTDTQTCVWILSRAKQMATEKAVPSVLPTTSAGSAANATATQGTGQIGFLTLTVSPFGNVTVGASLTTVATLVNNATSAQTLTPPTPSTFAGIGFAVVSTTCASTLAANSSCTITLKFTPQTAGAFNGSLSFATGQGQKTVALSGAGVAPTVTFTPQRANWGTVGIGSDSGDWPTITNTSTVPVLITAHSLASGPSGAWSWQGTNGYCLPGTTVLQPGGTCQTFFGMGTPTAVGSFSAVDQISYQAVGVVGSTFNVQQGYSWSTAATTASVSTLSFGNTTVSTTSAQQTFTIKNNATASPVNIAVSVTGNQPANFPVTNNCGANLAAGASCTVTVSFNPTWIANGFSANVQIATTYPRIANGGVEAYYYAAPSSSVALSGNGAGTAATLTSSAALTVPATWYGGGAQTVTATYRNDGNAPMTLASPSLAAPLSITSNNCASVAAGASCSMVVTAATNVPGLSQSQAFTPSGANTAPAATTVTWTTQTAVPHWSPTSLAFGNVEDGTTASQNITLINDGNVAYNWAANNGIANAPGNFSFNTSACGNVAPGASCNVVVTFTPGGYAGFAGSSISMSAASYNTNTFSVSGTALYAPSLVASPSSFSGSSVSPTPVSTSIAISNTGMWPTTFTLSMTGGASVSPASLSCPANASCGSVTVTTPTAVGNYSGTLTGTSSAGGSVSSVPMTMTVTTAPSITAFTVVTTTGLSTTFKNPNSVAVTPTASGITGNSVFANITTNTCTGSIAAGATCQITFSATTPDCKPDNYSTNSYVIDAAGAASGSTISRSSSSGICR